MGVAIATAFAQRWPGPPGMFAVGVKYAGAVRAALSDGPRALQNRPDGSAKGNLLPGTHTMLVTTVILRR